MITGLIVFAIVSIVLIWTYVSIELFLNNHNRLAATVFFGGLLVFCLALGVASQRKTTNPPCAKWETTMQFNPATKTMMPMRYCVQHGEWAEND